MYKEIIGSDTPWTEGQKLAIGLSGGSILVSASAGSGKTAVLTERIMQRIIDADDPADVRDFVVVTFTKAAAAEMKARLGKKLSDYVREHPEDRRVKYQIMHITEANISTIDAFCLSLLEKYQSVEGADYSAGMRILTQEDSDMLFRKALDAAVEEEFANGDDGFFALVDAMEDSAGGTSELKSAVIRIHGLMGRTPDRERFRARVLDAVGEDYSLTNDELISALFRGEAIAAAHYEGVLRALIAEAPLAPAGDDKLADKIKKQTDYLSAYLADMISLREAAEAGDYALCSELLDKSYGSMPQNRDTPPEWNEWMERRAAVVNECKKFKKDSASGFSLTEEDMRADAEALTVIVGKLLALNDLAEAKYVELKKDRGVWDYADLETKALKLLWRRGEDGVLRRTGVSLEEGRAHREILIDEYQDVNGLQEGIFSLIANDNTFCVGDVKQSIYGFRGCDSTIFKNKEKYYTETSGNGYVKRLNYSFRSAKNIIDFVNRVFTYCMTEEACGIDYTTSMLQSGGVYDKEHSGGVNLYSVTVKKEDVDKEGPADITVYDLLEGGKLSKKIDYSVENAVADKVQYYLDGKTYYDCDKGKEVKIKPEDIAVLVRNMSGGGIKKLLRVFGSRGIPISGSPKENLLEYKEVKVIKALVDLLNCYKQDIPLAICLKSLFGITDNELLKIKSAFYNERYFYQSVDKYISAVDGVDADLKNRLKEIKDYLFFERERAKYIGIDKVLNEIIDKVNYLEKLTLSPLGELKAMHVESFIALASRGNNTMYLSDFVKFLGRDSIDKIMATGLDGGVKLITMHKSKGLEFPVVIIPYADATFNAKDRSQTVIMDDEWGIITKNFDFNSYTKSSNVIRNHATKRLERKNLCDETRLFYVALTRAKYYLDIFIKTKKGKGNNKINSFYRLIPPTYNYEEIQSDSNITESNITTAFDFEKADVDTEKLIEKYVNFDYAYKNSLNLPLKASVTASLNNDNEDNVKYVFTDRESSIKAGLTAHKIMEKVDFYKPFDIELEKLIRSGEITKEELSEIDINCIKNTLTLPVFDRIKGYTFYKEQQFISRINASDLFEGTDSNDSVVLQGIIDLLAVKNNKAVIVDYKFSERQGENLIEHYKKQLYLYKHAVETVLGIDVKECYIVNLKKSVEYKI